jgi:ADP-ribose pyrophosphatase YjhB (NUDIX family)
MSFSSLGPINNFRVHVHNQSGPTQPEYLVSALPSMPITMNNTDFIGAGILLYSYNENGELTFLLGRKFRPHSTKHELYSDFGGKKRPGESPVQCAMRQFYEETKIITLSDYQLVNNYVSYYQGYYMFIVQVPYQPEIAEFYNTFFQTNVQNPTILFQKSDLRWFTLPQIINNKYHMRKYFYYNLLTAIQMYFTTRLIVLQ